MTNGARGEAIIQAGEREVRALFTNRALAEAEQVIGRSIIEISRGFVAGRVGITQVGQLLRCGMAAARREARAGNSNVTINEAYAVMDQAGYAVAARAVMEAITVTLSYQGPGGEAEEAEGPPE